MKNHVKIGENDENHKTPKETLKNIEKSTKSHEKLRTTKEA